uniref:RRM domain-containing protein n=1 Tax=Acrobeloides nanus TaxID=290746 RepID=A0A914EHU6_9BILA
MEQLKKLQNQQLMERINEGTKTRRSLSVVAHAQVKVDRATGRSRGFAFVEFRDTESCQKALEQREQQIKNKQVEVKPAKSRENKKVFIGGLPSEHPEEELRKHFEQFGIVEDIEWPFDKQSKARRNFAFIVFEEEDAADRAANVPKQTFGTRECDVKKAVPQGKRFAGMGNFTGRGMPMRGMGRGISNAMMPNPNQWLSNAWGHFGALAYPPAAGTGAWNEWYNNAAATYYAQAAAAGGSIPAYNNYNTMTANGFDYSQSTNVRPQAVTTTSNTPRYQSQQFGN